MVMKKSFQVSQRGQLEIRKGRFLVLETCSLLSDLESVVVSSASDIHLVGKLLGSECLDFCAKLLGELENHTVHPQGISTKLQDTIHS